MSEHIKPDDATRQEGAKEAQAEHKPDRMPTPEEEQEAEKNQLDPNAAKAYEEAIERGANQKGEGRLP
jgi:hypothetical protein